MVIYQYKHFPTDKEYLPRIPEADTGLLQEGQIAIPYFAAAGGVNSFASLVPNGVTLFQGN